MEGGAHLPLRDGLILCDAATIPTRFRERKTPRAGLLLYLCWSETDKGNTVPIVSLSPFPSFVVAYASRNTSLSWRRHLLAAAQRSRPVMVVMLLPKRFLLTRPTGRTPVTPAVLSKIRIFWYSGMILSKDRPTSRSKHLFFVVKMVTILAFCCFLPNLPTVVCRRSLFPNLPQ